MREIDCRNLSCPAPVITAKKALENAGNELVRIVVDAGAPRENVARFARSRGFSVAEEQLADGFALTIAPAPADSLLVATDHSAGGAVMIVASDRLGNGPDELGQLLMKNFLISLLEVVEPPEKIFFLNSGVLLTVNGAETVESLEKLAAAGVEIMSCGVCLDFFSVRDQLAVGSVTNMLTIAENLLTGRAVVRL